MIFYKFLRPSDEHFSKVNKRAAFELLLIPPANDPTEKFCYAEIPDSLFEQFLSDFGTDGEVLETRDEFPDSVYDIVNGRNRKFTIATPRKG